jgi:membrane associated rhomboid family serine protease
MKSSTKFDDTNIKFPCLSGTSPKILRDEYPNCTLSDICDFFGTTPFFSMSAPNQWFRFITPIFIHAGIVHLLLNVIFQINVGFQLGIFYLMKNEKLDFGVLPLYISFLVVGALFSELH